MINTQQEMILALSEAAELEHSLICQYLFAAYSIKITADGAPPAEQQRFDVWRESILAVAHQEMGHLGTVWNLQALVGAAPHVARVNFPQRADKYYPPSISFSLTPFNDSTLDRFIEFERPMPPASLLSVGVPDPLKYSRVGDLYAQIETAVAALSDADLLIDRSPTQDRTSWSNNVTLMAGTTRQDIQAALHFIRQQGEGAAGNISGSHFETFTRIKGELAAHLAAGGTAPSRDVCSNPWTTTHRDAEGGTLLDNPAAVELVGAFNLLYSCLLQMLRYYYSGGSETTAQRGNLKMAAYFLMRGCLRPLAREVTSVPALKAGGPMAGPSFEHFGGEDLSHHARVVWALMIRRLTDVRDVLSGNASRAVADIAGAVDRAIAFLKADQPL